MVRLIILLIGQLFAEKDRSGWEERGSVVT